MPATDRLTAARREQFARFSDLAPRWNDLDAFGHVNNAEFYGYFDTAIVGLLMEAEMLKPDSEIIAMVVESGARYHREVKFTDRLSIGLDIQHLGTSSLRYRIGVFCNDEVDAAVDGYFVHVFVDRASRRPTAIPTTHRTWIEALRR